jgi:DNA-binding response OmpR family regulator
MYVMAAAESIDSHLSGPETEAVTLLLVEEVSVTADIEKSYFSSVGFNVVAASTVADSEAAVSRQWVDIVILDVAFAKKKGTDLIPILLKKSQNPALKVIVTSVSGDASLRKSSIEAGASAFIVKPAPRPRYLKEIKKLSAQKARDSERVIQALEVEIVSGDHKVTTNALDISSEGIHLALDSKASIHGVGLEVILSFTVEGKLIKIQGQIVRQTPKGVGIRFTQLGAQAQRLLDKFLLRYSMEQQASYFYL